MGCVWARILGFVVRAIGGYLESRGQARSTEFNVQDADSDAVRLTRPGDGARNRRGKIVPYTAEARYYYKIFCCVPTTGTGLVTDGRHWRGPAINTVGA